MAQPHEAEAASPRAPARRHPVWMPAGGHAALWFWGGLCAILAVALLFLYRSYTGEERSGRLLRDQQQLLTGENQKLTAQIDKLQTELSQTGGRLRSQEEVLRATKESLETVQARNDQEIATAEAARKARAELQAALEKAAALPADSGFQVVADGDRVVVRLSHNLLFGANEVTLSAKGEALLKKLAPVLKGAAEVEVAGHTDTAPPSAATAKIAATNWELSALHAAAAARALVDDGLPAAKLDVRAYAGTHPLAGTDDRAKNRRIEIVLKPAATAAPATSAP